MSNQVKCDKCGNWIPGHATGSDDICTCYQVKEQPLPNGKGREIAALVQEDIERRAVIGERRYGERLRAHNGRDPLIDAYEEALDLAMYLRQLIEEKHGRFFCVSRLCNSKRFWRTLDIEHMTCQICGAYQLIPNSPEIILEDYPLRNLY